ncbi:chemokine (C-C motif) ligand 34b, duplicate 4 [Centropristis striata]|uniref:chemokine (C-C motif) ligand 34b, duplicate 4 n=1 Tax=Centropristis striata TaxID=184440 RepID=UPI0027E0E53A|nr:chemokine (C-C motif) ligand 34b, duplicate 4 [Centropristis striata]
MHKMSMMKTLSILLLLSVCLLSQASAKRLHVRKHVTPCCTAVSDFDISSEVTANTYSEQSTRSGCVKAVIFQTGAKKVCVDPEAEWVKNLMANMTKTTL